MEPARVGSLFRTALVSGWRRLTAECGVSKARTSMDRYASNPAICEVLALITHHYVPERRQWLEEVLQGLADLGARRAQALIVTNAADSASLTSIGNVARPHITANFSAEVVTAPPLLHPHYLPWAQKPLILERFLRSGSAFTHVVALEDDMVFGRQGFSYWLQYRPLLAAHGLIPSFMRTEMRPGDPVIYATDATAVTSMGSRQLVRVCRARQPLLCTVRVGSCACTGIRCIQIVSYGRKQVYKLLGDTRARVHGTVLGASPSGISSSARRAR